MNNREQEYYTVIRKGEEIKIPASEFISTGDGLEVPSTPFIPTQEERWQEENSNTQYAQFSSQPALNVQDPEEEYGEIYESPIVEHESIPTFQMLPDNRDVARKVNLEKDPYER